MDLPNHPTSRHAMSHATQGKEILYVRVSAVGGGYPIPPCDGPAGGFTGTPYPVPNRTQGILPNGGVSSGVLGTLP